MGIMKPVQKNETSLKTGSKKFKPGVKIKLQHILYLNVFQNVTQHHPFHQHHHPHQHQCLPLEWQDHLKEYFGT